MGNGSSAAKKNTAAFSDATENLTLHSTINTCASTGLLIIMIIIIYYSSIKTSLVMQIFAPIFAFAIVVIEIIIERIETSAFNTAYPYNGPESNRPKGLCHRDAEWRMDDNALRENKTNSANKVNDITLIKTRAHGSTAIVWISIFCFVCLKLLSFGVFIKNLLHNSLNAVLFSVLL